MTMDVEAPEVIEVEAGTEQVSCDGGGGALGHPLVYYSFGPKSEIVCGYCGRRFVRAEGTKH